MGHELIVDTVLEGSPTAWFAPTYRMMLDTFSDLTKIVKPITTKVNASEHRIELLTKGVIDLWSLDSADSAKGHKYKRVIVNEAAIAPRLLESFNEVIRPMLADMQGDAWFFSTPKGMDDFHRLYEQAGNTENWARWKYTTYDNPFIPKSEIDLMRAQLPERIYKQEILADFIAGEGAVFRNVRNCCVLKTPDEPKNHAGHVFLAGLDWGKSNDFTRIRIGCKQCKRVVDWDGFNQIDYAFQRERLKLIYDKWKPSSFYAESNSIGVPNIEMLARDGIPVTAFETTASSKPPLIENLALALERSEWKFPEEDVEELESYEMKVNETTHRPTYSAPEGGHDDRVMADALMLRAEDTWWVIS